MKKTAVLLFCISLSAGISAAELRDFAIILGGASSIQAGTYVPVTIAAYDTDGNIKTDYTGPAALGSASGGIYVAETGGASTGTFDNDIILGPGYWTGNVRFSAAGSPVTLVCEDAGGATGTAEKTVTPGPYSKLLFTVEGMEHAPGTAEGYTGTPVEQVIGVPFSVTVLACDSWNNMIETIPNPLSARIYAGPSDRETVVPASFDFYAESSASALFTMTINSAPSSPITYSLTAEDITGGGSKFFKDVLFLNLTDFYISAAAPQVITAGQPMAITVNVSHFPPPDLTLAEEFTLETIEIKAVTEPDRADANPPLCTVDLVSYPLPQIAAIDGRAVFTGLNLTYTKTGTIRIRPRNLGPTAMINANNNNRDSNYITVIADSPDSFTYTQSAERLSKGEQASFTVTVFDRFYNPVSGTAVVFAVTEGMGTLNVTSTATDVYGRAVSVFTAPQANCSSIVQAYVSELSEYAERTVITTLTEKFENWPNPFIAGRQETSIHYALDEDSAVKLRLYSMFGRLVWSKDIPKGHIEAGDNQGVAGGNTVRWNGMGDLGITVGAGLYVLKLEIKDSKGTRVLSRKIAVAK
ncbi:MAG TPA: hypothetical protein ENN43_03290 [bacterium]|nr:hypothetical protein [bacterium]